MDYKSTYLWRKTLGIQGCEYVDRLRVSYDSLRENMKGLLQEVRSDFPNLTDHSIEHVDALWNIASLIVGDDYEINPLEGFVLGCAMLVHDSVLSYKAFGGKDALRNTIEWKDQYYSIKGTDSDTEEGLRSIDFYVIRKLHAIGCQDMLLRCFEAVDGRQSFLLMDDLLRKNYGSLIGQIAYSHHWDSDQLLELSPQVNPISGFPVEWVINPLKLSCILRCADAAAIDSKRAPDYLFRILQLNGVSKDHWMAQNRLAIAVDVNDPTCLSITSTMDFTEDEFSAWNVIYDAVRVVNQELENSACILSEKDRFKVRSVSGSKSRKELSKYIRTKDWIPSDVNVHINDVARLISMLGGKELYGREDHVLIVLKELIQNARDAIYARRLLEDEDYFTGRIDVCVEKIGDTVELSVIDNGVGMSLHTISHSLLNFGNSFWHCDDVNVELPGLKSKGYHSVGQYGIGFFSAFMISKSLKVDTRKYTDGLEKSHLVKFPSGLTLSPIFSTYTRANASYSTKVSLILDEKYATWPVEYVVKRNTMGAINFSVPFHAMLSTIVAGLDVDVYYKEFDNDKIRVHERIDSPNLNRKLWLRNLSFADYQNDAVLDEYIDNNYSRLEYIYDDIGNFLGLAAVNTRIRARQDFLSAGTIGGLITEFHSRSGEYWIGILEQLPAGAKRNGGDFKASDDILIKWVNKQAANVIDENDLQLRFRLQLVLKNFKSDPKDIAIAFCVTHSDPERYITITLNKLVTILLLGKKLIFIDSSYSTNKADEGHGDIYLDFTSIAAKMQDDEMLYMPYINSAFISYKLINHVPVNDNGFIDCLYRTAKDMGCSLKFSYRENYTMNRLGVMSRALVIEI